MCRVKTTPIKTNILFFFSDIEKLILIVVWNVKGTRIVKTDLKTSRPTKTKTNLEDSQCLILKLIMNL